MREKLYYIEILSLLKHGVKKYNGYKGGFLKKVWKNIIIKLTEKLVKKDPLG